MTETVVISLGGSIMVPDEINVDFLKKFRELILRHISTKRFIIIVGGGKTCRKYQNATRQITKVRNEDLDWLGIHATRLNAHLLRTIFREHANKAVIKDPTGEIDFKEKILIAAGWKPGFSTDYDAVVLAERFNVKTIINLSDIDHVYDKDPKKHANAKPLKKISWDRFKEIVGTKWDPGLNVPFDPVASKLAGQSSIKVAIMKGSSLENLENLLSGKDFKGTLIG